MEKRGIGLFSLSAFAFLGAVVTAFWGAEQIQAGPEKTVSKQVAAATPEAIKAGKMLFVKATCWGCHPHGENSLNGDKPLKGPRFAKKYQSDDELMATIRRGSVTRGMPPFPVEKLSEQDLRQIVVFIRSLSSSAKP